VVIDVTALELNKTIHIGEIKAPAGVEILGDKNIPVVSVAVPRAEEEPAVVEGAAAGDVEMIKEKKEGEEGAAAGAAPAKGAAKPAAGDKAAAAPAAGDKKAAAPAAEKKK
jgi:large subunit ribosomal protein L25